jgi:hypothetical protein
MRFSAETYMVPFVSSATYWKKVLLLVVLRDVTTPRGLIVRMESAVVSTTYTVPAVSTATPIG